MKKLFVGGLAFTTDDDGLRTFFEQFGTVTSATVINDRDSGRSRGFGFVEYADDAEADRAIKEGDGQELDGRTIAVSQARLRSDNGGSRGGRDDRRGGGFRPRS